MSFWNDIDFNSIHTNDDGVITYNGNPLRFQIPIGYTDIGVSEWSRLSIKIDEPHFFEWFKKLEEFVGKTEPYNSVISTEDNTINLKVIDGFTQFFNKNREYQLDPPSISNCKVIVKMEFSKKYGPFKNEYGVVCKAYQIVYFPEECGFSQ